MAEKNSQSVPIRTNTQEKYHTHVPDFLAGEFLPMQLIYLYRGKTKSSLPGISAKGFWIYLTQDLKHYFNTTPCKEEKTLKMTDSIINPYLVQTRRHLKLPPTQQAILIWPDVFFRGQKTQNSFVETGFAYPSLQTWLVFFYISTSTLYWVRGKVHTDIAPTSQT